MENMVLISERTILSNAETLIEKFEEIKHKFNNVSYYSNSLASAILIIEGTINYFDNLGPFFLGKENSYDIPSETADHFANNLYRLFNAIEYLGEMWKVKVTKNDEIKFLSDIRTLIVHSGENISKVKSLKLEKYKDSQLGRIFHKSNHDPFNRFGHYPNMDYCIEVWNDKHDKGKKENIAEVDYHIKHKSFVNLSIFLSGTDVRNIVLGYVEDFLDTAINLELKSIKVSLPDIKDRVINQQEKKICFDKIAELISKNARGGYFIENDIERWDGYGLKRLFNYCNESLSISDEVRNIINMSIFHVISKYWDDYQNEEIQDEDLPKLNIMNVFSEYTPSYDFKHYLESQKLFLYIVPYFNTNEENHKTDYCYLDLFINKISKALEKKFVFETTTNNLLCEYIIQSVQFKLDKY